mmetsp:Transcript_25083/g.66332  ORF Transcript_25083/g.66332 Transcript_25083/m.66332 type:complete len:658 (-) Transcript_25083:174-2147(-)
MTAHKNNGAAAQAGVAKTGRPAKQDRILAPLDHEARQCLERACSAGVMSLGELDPTVLQELGRKAAANQLSVVRKLVVFAPNVQKQNKTGLLINIMKRRYKSLPQLPASGSGDSGLSTAEGDSSTEEGADSEGVNAAAAGRSEDASAAGRHLLSLVNPAAAASMGAPANSRALSAMELKSEIRKEARAARAAEAQREGPPPVPLGVKDMISGEPGALRVSARGRLASPEVAFALIRELRVTLLRHRAANQPLGVADLDLSQNPLLMEHYRQIFHLLGKVGARVERFRFYGCATFDDEAMGVLANHIAGLSADNVPLELHLSDCAITTAGFKLLMHALDESPHFPAKSSGRAGKPLPLYLRLENNYIDEESIQDCMAAGLLQPLSKAKGRRSAELAKSDVTKANLVITGSGFQQLDGPAPAVAGRRSRAEDRKAKERAGDVEEVDGVGAPAVDPYWQQAMEIIESCAELADPDTVVQWVRHLETAQDPVAEANRILAMSFRLMGQGFCQPSMAAMEEQTHSGAMWDYESGMLLGQASPELSYGADPLEYYGMMHDNPLAYSEAAYDEDAAAAPARRRRGKNGVAAAEDSVNSHLLGLLAQLQRGDAHGDKGGDAGEVGGVLAGGAEPLPKQPRQAVPAPEPSQSDGKPAKKGRNKIGA